MGFDLGGGKKGKIRPAMNVTPLVDVVLVLLIIFMVITPMLVKQLSVNVPTKPKDENKPAEPAKPGDDDEPQVILHIDGAGRAWINRNQISDAELPVRLKRVFAARADQTLFFDADDNVRYERALQIMDIARGTGLATIAVLTDPVAIE